MARDFSTISPSARWLLLAKAHSGLPYAREVAELVFGRDEVAAAAIPESPAVAIRRRHFELRARSIDESLDLVGATRIIELAAGLSVRGLARAERGAHYLDTDLPEIVALKRELVTQVSPARLAGTYRLEPLDVMDELAFARAVAAVPEGPIAFAHEGLLMYLGPDEKQRLAASIREALRARGGHWITADVYLRRVSTIPRDAQTEQFLAEHRVEEQKFGSWDEAETFFSSAGFAVERKLVPASDPALVRQTWILVPRD